jgi:transcriptional adapter 3
VQNKSTKVIDRGYDDNMAAKLSSFSPHPSILSPLLKKAPDAVPPTDELEKLHDELKLAREKALERSKKANDDLKTIEESIRRMTEREKGKFKAIDKIKRERDCTYMLLINDFENKNLTYGFVCIS